MSMTDETRQAARALRTELFSDELLDQLMSRVDSDGVALTGEGGFLPELVKAVLERGMDAELTDHLGYERGDRGGHGSGNSRNGTTPKTVGTEVGDIGLDQPRDRNATFASALVPKGARRLGGLEDMIISLYAGRDDDPRHPAPPGLHARHRPVARDDQQRHRGCRRGGHGLAVTAVGAVLSRRLPRRAGGQGPRRRPRREPGRAHRRRRRHGRRQARPGHLDPSHRGREVLGVV